MRWSVSVAIGGKPVRIESEDMQVLRAVRAAIHNMIDAESPPDSIMVTIEEPPAESWRDRKPML